MKLKKTIILKIGDIMDIDIMKCLSVVPASIFSLVTLFIVTKIMGKKQISQLSLFDYVIGISIGNFTAEMTMNLNEQYLTGVVAIIVFGLVSYIVSIITMKSIKLRRIIIGVPTIIIQNGKIIEKSLKDVKLDVNDFLEECRGQGYFDLSQIEYAIMEANGKVSIMPKSEYKPLTPLDMKLTVEKEGLCANVVIDGNIMEENIKNMHKTDKWVRKELKLQGYKDLNNILLATLDINDKIVVYEKNKSVKVYNVLE